MADLEVRIVRLEPLEVAYSLAYGLEPEGEAWAQILGWAQARRLPVGGGQARCFGFNNPEPAPGTPNHGYEQWLEVEAGVEPGEGVKRKTFAGGLYAVSRCRGVGQLYPTWQALVAWREDSPYQPAYHQWLEECLNPEILLAGAPDYEQLVFDLYLPVAK
jgi:DNA gyrase inhibitor GyrI